MLPGIPLEPPEPMLPLDPLPLPPWPWPPLRLLRQFVNSSLNFL